MKRKFVAPLCFYALLCLLISWVLLPDGSSIFRLTTAFYFLCCVYVLRLLWPHLCKWSLTLARMRFTQLSLHLAGGCIILLAAASFLSGALGTSLIALGLYQLVREFLSANRV